MAEYEELLRQHNEIMTHLERLEYLVGSEARGSAHSSVRQQLAQHLTALKECLVPHFAGEERGGYFTDARTNRPGLGRKIDSLGAEHAELIEQLEHAIKVAPEGDLPELQADVATILERLREHETAERGLLQDAALVDIGPGD